MATVQERVGIVETKLESVSEKISDLKADVKEMHDCLDNTRDTLVIQLEKMTDEYRLNAGKYYEHADHLNELQSAQHKELAGKIDNLEKFKTKGTLYVMLVLAFAAGTGWMGHLDLAKLIKFIGI